jgi:hypothetical protein
MKRSMTSLLVTSILALASVADISPAVATIMITPQVVGHVTAISGATLIVVDGHQYQVAVNSPAFQTLQGLHVGDQVALILDGPARSSSSHVTSIQVSPPK